MSKAAVTRLFVGSVVAAVAGILLALAAVWFAFANGTFVMDGADVTGIEATPGAWSTIGVVGLAAIVVIGGCVGGLVAWIGALLNTALLEDKTWFVVLLVFGLLSFGLIAMIAYVIGGPDGTRKTSDAALPTPA
jgi:hypothetical protein